MQLQKSILVLGLIALTGCGIQVYDSGTGLGQNTSGSQLSQNSQVSEKTLTANRNPLILSFTANPLNTVGQGDSLTFNVDVIDEDNDTLKYTWSSTGGTLSSNTGRLVSWTPPTKSGVYTVLVSISDGKGGTAEGAQNLIVKADGSVELSGDPATASI
jgi:hypothetical protein